MLALPMAICCASARQNFTRPSHTPGSTSTRRGAWDVSPTHLGNSTWKHNIGHEDSPLIDSQEGSLLTCTSVHKQENTHDITTEACAAYYSSEKINQQTREGHHHTSSHTVFKRSTYFHVISNGTAHHSLFPST